MEGFNGLTLYDFGMITPRQTQAVEDVARHYDELHRYYLEVWGEHVHHGLWLSGKETPEAATRQLVTHMAERLAIVEGDEVLDVGCGYGGAARILAQTYGANVTGLTVSREQFDYAVAQSNRTENPRYRLLDWLANTFADAAFDRVYFIEVTEHIADKAACFAEAFRVLKPRGRIAVYAWLAREGASGWEVERLLEPICREGRLPGMGTEQEYRDLLARAGFEKVSFEDFSRNVRRTWSICARRMAARLLVDAEARRFLFSGPENRVFAKTVFRIWLAYRTGAMRYGLFIAEKGE